VDTLKLYAVLARTIKPAVAQEQISQGFAMDLKRPAKLRRGAVIATENEARCEGLFTGDQYVERLPWLGHVGEVPNARAEISFQPSAKFFLDRREGHGGYSLPGGF